MKNKNLKYDSSRLADFEKELDDIVNNYSFFKLPIRSRITCLYTYIYFQSHGSPCKNGTEDGNNIAWQFISRLSYLYPLLVKGEKGAFGISAIDALSPYIESETIREEVEFLLKYGHFCEIMPKVHRKHFKLESKNLDFILSYENNKISDCEIRDNLLGEISINWAISLGSKFKDLFDELAIEVLNNKSHNCIKMSFIIKSIYDCYCKHTYEFPSLTNQGFLDAVGCSKQEFRKFRAAICSIMDFCYGISQSIKPILRRTPENESNPIFQEYLEWITVNWNKDFLYNITSSVSGIELKKIESLFRPFTININNGEINHAKDGFFPPFLEMNEAILFNPECVKAMLHSRNLIFSIKNLDQKLFDDQVSQHMEPALLETASNLFSLVPDLKVVQGYEWENSEIDMFVYHKHQNTALHIQAKAFILPHGARMIKAMDDRVSEAVQQLDKFRVLDQVQKDQIISNAIGEEIQGVRFIDAVLCSSYFGTAKVYKRLNGTLLLNIATLLKSIELLHNKILLSDLNQELKDITDNWINDTKPQWETFDLSLIDKKISLPSMVFDEHKVNQIRINLWKYINSLDNFSISNQWI